MYPSRPAARRLLGFFALVLWLAGCAAPPPPEAEAVPTEPAIRAGTEDQTWLVVLQGTPVYSIRGDLLATARPGQWYRVSELAPGWALAVAEDDPTQSPVWLENDGRVQFRTGRLNVR